MSLQYPADLERSRIARPPRRSGTEGAGAGDALPRAAAQDATGLHAGSAVLDIDEWL